ncbi:MAG: heme-binding protein [Acetobacteraceae bacterium]|nr:heme-binding protein [Acetobacteraceae bacterium]
MELSLQTADAMAARAVSEASVRFRRPVCVAVCDQDGFLLAFSRMDGAPARSIRISQCKAYTAARMGVDTSAFNERLHREDVPASAFCDDQFTQLPGGSVLKDGDRIIGGVGISGLAPSEDQAISEMLAGMAGQPPILST